MDKRLIAVKVIFEEPFWILLFERVEEEKISVCKVTFGAEPKDYELQEFILRHFQQLRFSPYIAVAMKEARYNPKKMQRKVKRELYNNGIGTKSQQALQLQREQFKTERKSLRNERQEEEKQRQFELRQQKKKKKHRGR